MGKLRLKRTTDYVMVDHVSVDTRRGPTTREKVVPESPQKRRLSSSPSKQRPSTPIYEHIVGDTPNPKRMRTGQKVH